MTEEKPERPPGAARAAVSEAGGAYDRVRLGQQRAAALRQLGRPTVLRPREGSVNPFFLTIDSPESLPADIATGDAAGRPAVTADVAIYPDVQLSFVRRRVVSILVYGRGARTGTGVGLGDPLENVRRRYPGRRIVCAKAASESGPTCELELGRVCMHFGGDPISVIGMADRAFDWVITQDGSSRPTKCASEQKALPQTRSQPVTVADFLAFGVYFLPMLVLFTPILVVAIRRDARRPARGGTSLGRWAGAYFVVAVGLWMGSLAWDSWILPPYLVLGVTALGLGLGAQRWTACALAVVPWFAALAADFLWALGVFDLTDVREPLPLSFVTVLATPWFLPALAGLTALGVAFRAGLRHVSGRPGSDGDDAGGTLRDFDLSGA